MSKQTACSVQFMEDGRLVKTVVPKETEKAINDYNKVYENINQYKIRTFRTPSKHQEHVCDVVIAQSSEQRIVCIKDFVPNISERIIEPQYQCGILKIGTNDVEHIEGGVELLYYKLLHGRAK